jgi:hypothetical protein
MGPLPPGNAAAVAAQAYGDQQKIAVAAGDGVYHRWRVGNPGGGWSAWEAVPGLGAPAIDLAFLPGGFGGVVPPGGTALAFSPAAAGRWELFAVDEYETVHRSGWRDAGDGGTGWSAWTDAPAPEGLPVTSIAASCASSPDLDQKQVGGHRQDLVAVADGRVWHRERHGATGAMPAWSDWEPLPGVPAGVADVACSSRGPDHVEVFAVDHRGRISRRDYTERSGWSGWQDLPAPAGERAAAVASTSHPFSPYQKLAVLTATGRVYHAWRSAFGPGGESGWTPWRDLPALRPA